MLPYERFGKAVLRRMFDAALADDQEPPRGHEELADDALLDLGVECGVVRRVSEGDDVEAYEAVEEHELVRDAELVGSLGL